MRKRSAALGWALAFVPLELSADDALVAAAANFAEPLTRLERAFEASHPHRLRVAVGSTGKLYAQVLHGAPFDILLAADQERPTLLERAGLAVPGSRRTYAVGRLALWSANPERIQGDAAELLEAGNFRRLAMANPALAPYGAAAREVLQGFGLYATLRDRIVTAENIGQTYAMVATGNAEIGFVAASGIRESDEGSRWDVPPDLHAPIRQDAVLLAHGADNPAARQFLEFLHGERARAIISDFGYGVDP
ncbi:MAG: molybdate ABC transporter substrate-binding protein [Gammaproteobacteria bacterium]|nr:molybdate ABC transporter substrate-binding protein [Gammaproteobacteria bacterium]